MNIKSFFVCLLLICFEIKAQPFGIKPSANIDYNDMKNWAAHPNMNDPSDRIPKALEPLNNSEKIADVFFIHPTTLTDSKDTSWNADLMDKRLNQKTDNSTILYQASVFNEQSRIFAPRYRQAHIRCFYTDDARAKDAFEIAYQDIRASFIYYLEHNNQGRPIIIASHSQGTKHAGRLLKEFFENQPLMRSLVCAYIIGMPVPEDYFKELKPCSDENQTGCFVAWRSFHENYIPEFVKEEKFKSVVVNPLSWKINDEKISRKKNAGGVLMKFDKIVPKVVSAQIHHNILWCSKPNVFGKIFIRKKNYHIGDINLFYMNIRENVKNRLKNYLSEGKL